MKPKLIFIYNASSGKLNALLDVGHKLLSPKTYKCDLCALTHDTFSENKKWKLFRKEIHIDMNFYHSDEFEKAYPNKSFEYPIILKETKDKLTTFLSKKDLKTITSTETLIETIKTKLLVN